MSDNNTQRQMDFIVEQQAKFTVDIEQLKESQKELTAAVARIASEMEADRKETREVLTSVMNEMREGFNNLIVANEVTRNLAEEIGRLAVATSQRVTNIESNQ
jgi:uncharacterized protein YgbK (DUF1537 family)